MILCNRNREQVLEVTQQQLIIFPLIIARCAEATLRVLLCQTGMCCNQRGRGQAGVHVCFGVIKRFKRDNIVSSDIMFGVLSDRLRTRNAALKEFCSCFARYCAEGCGFADLFGVLPTTFWAKKKFDHIADMPTCRRQRWTIPRDKKTTEQANACSVMFYA